MKFIKTYLIEIWICVFILVFLFGLYSSISLVTERAEYAEKERRISMDFLLDHNKEYLYEKGFEIISKKQQGDWYVFYIVKSPSGFHELSLRCEGTNIYISGLQQ